MDFIREAASAFLFVCMIIAFAVFFNRFGGGGG